MAGEVTIRPATTEEAEDAIAILDGAILSFDRDAIRDPSPETTVLLAITDRPVGAALVVETELVAVAVRPRHRRRGIGTALVRGCQDRRHALELSADAALAPFYVECGFELVDRADGRITGIWRSDDRLND